MNRFYTDIDCMKKHVESLNRRNFGVFQPQVGDVFKFEFKSGRDVRLAVDRRVWIATPDGMCCRIELYLTSACTSYGLHDIPALEAYVRDQVLSAGV